jgi:hypothetical protein
MGFYDNVNFNEPSLPNVEEHERPPLTHPDSPKSTSHPMDDNILKARYRMFDLSQVEQTVDLENIVSQAMTGEIIIKQEKWSHDKDGSTTVTLSWFEVIPKKKKKAGDVTGLPDMPKPLS